MIEINNLNKVFKVHKKEPGLMASIKSLFTRKKIEKSALKNINLKINEGEIVGLIGENGAGKTTLTKILSGIIYPTSGEAKVLGFTPWERDNNYRKQMSVIMGQKAQLWWDLPAHDGLLLLKEIYRLSDEDFNDQLNYLSECLNIKNELTIQIRKLSLGERMKVELIAALIHRPKVIFLDEPTIGLDLSSQKAVRSFLKSYKEKYNPIMILTSHYMADIEELCERVAIMKKGEIIYDGSLQKIKDKFNTFKVIKAKTESDIPQDFINNFPAEFGEVEVSENEVNIKSPIQEALNSSRYLLNHLEVSDLSINEEDIGTLIEKILKEGNHLV